MSGYYNVPGTLVPKNFLPAIGVVTVAYAHMDDSLNHVIWMLLGCGQASGSAITSTILNLTNRTNLARQLLETTNLLDRAGKRKLRETINEAENLASERNRLIHDRYHSVTTGGSGAIGLLRQDARFRPRKETTHTRKSLRTMGRNMLNVTKVLDDYEMIIYKLLTKKERVIREKMIAAQTASPGTPPRRSRKSNPSRS